MNNTLKNIDDLNSKIFNSEWELRKEKKKLKQKIINKLKGCNIGTLGENCADFDLDIYKKVVYVKNSGGFPLNKHNIGVFIDCFDAIDYSITGKNEIEFKRE